MNAIETNEKGKIKMFIQYINKIPSKIEFFEMLRRKENNSINISELDDELSQTITAVCAYSGDNIVGLGRVKKEENYLYIEDMLISLDEYKEEIQKNIIVKLFDQINQIKQTNIEVRDCLELNKPETNFYKRYNFLLPEKRALTLSM